MKLIRPFMGAAIGLTLAAALPASAAIIDYTVSGVASGLYTNGATVTPFNNVNVAFNLYGDTSTFVEVPGVAHGLRITSATMSAPGLLGSSPFDCGGCADNLHLFVLEGLHPNVIVFANPPHDDHPPVFDSLAFVGYDGFSNLGPIPIHYDGNVDPSFANGADANFTSFTNVTFQAQAVPEPAAWAMMLVGFGGIGAMLRRAKQKPWGVAPTA